jgi:Domain of unknown function (DUF4267)
VFEFCSVSPAPETSIMKRNSVAFWLVALFGIGLIGVGAASLVAPQTAAALFGVPASGGSTSAYIWAAGTRDIAIGGFVLVLVGLRVNARVVGAFMLVVAVIPVGDLVNVYIHAGAGSREALVLHGVSAVFLVALGRSLWRGGKASDAP